MAIFGRRFPIRGHLVSKLVAATGIQFDAASNSGYQTLGTSYDFNITIGSGSNRYLIVGVSMLSLAGVTVSSVALDPAGGNQALTFLGARGSLTGSARVELWGLAAPASGTLTVRVTFSGSIGSGASAAGAISFTGVHQTSSVEGIVDDSETNGLSAADATVNVTTAANNDWLVSVVATDDASITVGGTATQRSNVTGTLGSGATSTFGPETPAGTQAMSWTNVGALKTWSTAAIALRPTTASSLAEAAAGGVDISGSAALVASSLKAASASLAVSAAKVASSLKAASASLVVSAAEKASSLRAGTAGIQASATEHVLTNLHAAAASISAAATQVASSLHAASASLSASAAESVLTNLKTASASLHATATESVLTNLRSGEAGISAAAAESVLTNLRAASAALHAVATELASSVKGTGAGTGVSATVVASSLRAGEATIGASAVCVPTQPGGNTTGEASLAATATEIASSLKAAHGSLAIAASVITNASFVAGEAGLSASATVLARPPASKDGRSDTTLVYEDDDRKHRLDGGGGYPRGGYWLDLERQRLKRKMARRRAELAGLALLLLEE